MDDEKLARMRQDAAELGKVLEGTYTVAKPQYDNIVSAALESYVHDVPALLAEVEQLRKVVQKVAHDGEYDNDLCIFGEGCLPVWNVTLSDYEHAPECYVTKARAILAE